ncbi:MAG: RNA 2',3'-cyclic phosphodiesterase [archaeon]
MTMRRAFIAVNLPGSVKEKIFREFSQEFPKEKFKSVEMENLHFTLVFLGNASEEKLGEIRITLRKINGFGEFGIGLEGTGSFGTMLVWIRIAEGKEKIAELHSRICGLIGIRGGGFSAHLTVARNRRANPKEFAEVMKRVSAKKFQESFEVKSVELMESVLSTRGPEYKIIESFALC